MTPTFHRLAAILAKDYKIDPGQLTLDTPLEALGIDSLGAVELLWNVEDVFRIKLPPDMVALVTVGDVVAFVDNLVATQHGATAVGTAADAAMPTA